MTRPPGTVGTTGLRNADSGVARALRTSTTTPALSDVTGHAHAAARTTTLTLEAPMDDLNLPDWIATHHALTDDDRSTLAAAMQAAPVPGTSAVDDGVLVPDNADEWADGLAAVLRRIPQPWGRYVSVGPGWYPIVVQLDQAIASLEPDYWISQVKEKFGDLRYYLELRELACCAQTQSDVGARFPDQPASGDTDAWASWTAAHEDAHEAAVVAAFDTHERTDDVHAAATAARDANQKLIDALVRAAEDAAARTCDVTGGPGLWMRDRGGWYVTRDPLTAETGMRLAPGMSPAQTDAVLARLTDDPAGTAQAIHNLAAANRDLRTHINRLLERAEAPATDD
jgi:hypothetical protein